MLRLGRTGVRVKTGASPPRRRAREPVDPVGGALGADQQPGALRKVRGSAPPAQHRRPPQQGSTPTRAYGLALRIPRSFSVTMTVGRGEGSVTITVVGRGSGCTTTTSGRRRGSTTTTPGRGAGCTTTTGGGGRRCSWTTIIAPSHPLNAKPIPARGNKSHPRFNIASLPPRASPSYLLHRTA